MSRRFFVPLLALLALTAGCGGGEDAASVGGAEFAPPDAALFLTVNTDFDSEEWKEAQALLDRFPDGDELVDLLLEELESEGVNFERDVKSALGPEVNVVALDLSEDAEVVAYTQAKDRGKLEELLEKGDEQVVTREVDGWTLFAQDEASLDAFVDARGEGSLAESEDFGETMAELPAGAIARLYLSGEALREAMTADDTTPDEAIEAFFPGGRVPSVGLALGAEEEGIRLDGVVRLEGDTEGFVSEPYEAELPGVLPGGALAYLSFKDLESQLSRLREAFAAAEPELERDIARLESELGVSLEEDLFPLFAGEGALYVRESFLLPEVTLVLEVENEQQALQTLAKIVEGVREYADFLGEPRETEIAGVQAVEIPLEDAPVGLFYAAFDGHLVVTTSRDGIAALREEDNRLSDDPLFNEALEQAGMPAETIGFAYLNLEELVGLVLDFADFGGQSIPGEVESNLEPLEHLVLYGSKQDQVVEFAAFLSVE